MASLSQFSEVAATSAEPSRVLFADIVGDGEADGDDPIQHVGCLILYMSKPRSLAPPVQVVLVHCITTPRCLGWLQNLHGHAREEEGR